MAQLTVFISYRRTDTRADAGRLYDALSRRFGRNDVFMDVDTVRPGQDWVKAIDDAIDRCDVVLALIGDGWLSARSEVGLRRLDEPTDRVRLELETALAKGKGIVPLLVDGAQMPSEDDLPPSLRPLARHQALGVNHATFSSDLARLVRALRPFAVQAEPAVRAARRSAKPDARTTGSASAVGAEAVTRGFLFADLRGYADYVEQRGDDAGAQLLERYRRLLRDVISHQPGAEVRTEGDSFYVLFPSASRAVAAGLAIVGAAAADAADHPDAPIQVGVGIHAGETAETTEGPIGSAVNVAARICSAAAAGEVLVSDTVRGLTRTRQVAGFEPAGTRRLKGIVEPMALYRALPSGTAVVATPVRRSLLRLTVPLLAVISVVAILIIGPAYALFAGGGGSTPSASRTSTLGASATAGATPAPLSVGRLAPGTYVTNRFEPRFVVELDSAWSASPESPDYFSLFLTDQPDDQLSFFRVLRASSDGCFSASQPVAGPVGLYDWLRLRPELAVGRLVHRVVHSIPALPTQAAATSSTAQAWQVDVQVTGGSACDADRGVGLYFFPLSDTEIIEMDPAHRWLFIRQGLRARVLVASLQSGEVTIVAHTLSDADFTTFSARATELLEHTEFVSP